MKNKIQLQICSKNYKYMVIIICTLLIFSIITVYKAIDYDLVIEEKNKENTIEEKFSFDYIPIVKESTLYPTGGKVEPDKVIFSQLTDKLVIQLNSVIESDKAVKIDGNVEVFYSLESEETFKRQFPLVSQQVFNADVVGTSHKLLEKEVQLDTTKIYDYIDTVEEETLYRANRYLLKIKPVIEGNVYDENGKIIHEINTDLEIPFEIAGQYIKYIGESTEKETINITPIQNIDIIPQTISLLGIKMNVISARYILGSICVILSFALVSLVISRIKFMKEKRTETYFIDKKYKSRIIEISEKISFKNTLELALRSFKALLQIAEKNEESILRYEINKDHVYYYVVGNNTIYYYYSISDISIEGCDLANDA